MDTSYLENGAYVADMFRGIAVTLHRAADLTHNVPGGLGERRAKKLQRLADEITKTIADFIEEAEAA
jgi:hypothetical protein